MSENWEQKAAEAALMAEELLAHRSASIDRLLKRIKELEAKNAELQKELKKDLQTLSKAAWYLDTGQSARQVIDFIRCRLAFKTKQQADDEGERDV